MIDKNEWKRNYREQKKARGECYDCPSLADKNRVYCFDCLVVRAIRRANERKERKNGR